MGVRTIEEAHALPEIDRAELLTQPLGAEGMDGQDIACFMQDGVAYEVVSTRDGWRKVRFGGL